MQHQASKSSTLDKTDQLKWECYLEMLKQGTRSGALRRPKRCSAAWIPLASRHVRAHACVRVIPLVRTDGIWSFTTCLNASTDLVEDD